MSNKAQTGLENQFQITIASLVTEHPLYAAIECETILKGSNVTVYVMMKYLTYNNAKPVFTYEARYITSYERSYSIHVHRVHNEIAFEHAYLNFLDICNTENIIRGEHHES